MATDQPDRKMVETIRTRFDCIRRQMDDAANLANREPGSVKLIAVTKFFPAVMAEAAVVAGLTDLGENRVQEMLAKQADLASRGLSPRWHLIGTLQKNKVRQVIGRTSLIHSGDSLALLAEISRRSVAAELVTHVLLQINPAGEETKHGFLPSEFGAAAKEAILLPGLQIDGIMAMAPLLKDPAEALPFFQISASLFDVLCEIFQQLKPDQPQPSILSMGMSEDFPQAIACGATHIRIGTALFGPRPPVV